MLKKRVVGGCDLKNFLNELVLLDLVLFFKLAELANEVLEPTACEAHDSVLDGDYLVGLGGASHAGITLFLFDLEDESVHVGIDNVDGLVGTEVVLNCLSQCLHLTLDSVDLSINLFELGAEVWVDDIVILLGLTDVDALFEHCLELSEFLKCGAERLNNLSSQGVIFLSDVLVEVTNQALQGVNHVVDLDAVDKLGVVA